MVDIVVVEGYLNAECAVRMLTLIDGGSVKMKIILLLQVKHNAVIVLTAYSW